ncbi:MAG: endonuclease/exonuclease/phosphatase family protein, partial [Lentisphaeria bacterium]|nr:endonuclease/exonuclease/phosphatase family protein [Lentisphaeria bacterium]
MKKFEISKVLDLLDQTVKEFQVPVVDLIQAQTSEPWKVLVATILSARTKDEVTAAAVRRLFPIIKNLQGLSTLTTTEIEKIIHPSGFYKNKAKYLSKLPQAVDDLFDGVLPDTVDELVKLPGVGRKTANLVVAVAFNKPAICVDTHVHRIMNIWGYVNTKTPEQTEVALRKKLPQKHWIQVNRILVAFGQSICRPIGPHCEDCPLSEVCLKKGVTPRKGKGKNMVREKLSQKGLKLMSWNVNGIRAVEKKGFVELLKKENPDVIGLQETKAQKDQLSDELINIDGYHSYWFSAARKGYSSVAVYSKVEPLKVINGLDIEEFDKEGRVITLEFDTYFFV